MTGLSQMEQAANRKPQTVMQTTQLLVHRSLQAQTAATPALTNATHALATATSATCRPEAGKSDAFDSGVVLRDCRISPSPSVPDKSSPGTSVPNKVSPNPLPQAKVPNKANSGATGPSGTSPRANGSVHDNAGQHRRILDVLINRHNLGEAATGLGAHVPNHRTISPGSPQQRGVSKTPPPPAPRANATPITAPVLSPVGAPVPRLAVGPITAPARAALPAPTEDTDKSSYSPRKNLPASLQSPLVPSREVDGENLLHRQQELIDNSIKVL